jgi:hypothetical protein
MNNINARKKLHVMIEDLKDIYQACISTHFDHFDQNIEKNEENINSLLAQIKD